MFLDLFGFRHRLLCSLFCLFCAPYAHASPWVGTTDKQLHNDLQTLSEWGYVSSNVTTYPVPWKGVASDLDQLSLEDMPYMPKQAALRLKHYLNLQKQQKRRTFVQLNAATEQPRYTSLDQGWYAKSGLKVSNEAYWERFSFQLTVNYQSAGDKNLDNSFVAYQFGGWNLRAGSLDQWWGPGQGSSLVLSNNSRPLPTVALSRSTANASQSPYLAWLGPWFFTTQVAQLEEDRSIANTRMLLNRFTFSPLERLELGLSWMAMWGGDGQSNEFSDLFDAALLDDPCELINGVCQAETGDNYLAGLDIKYSFHAGQQPITVYGQWVSDQDDKAYELSNSASLLGVSTYWYGTKWFIEASDTRVDCAAGQQQIPSCFYDHNKYADGYRFHGRAIGSTFDGNAKQLTAGANMRFTDGAIAEVMLHKVESNEAQSLAVFTPLEDALRLSGFYQRPLGKWLLEAGGSVGSVARFSTLNDKRETDAELYFNAVYAF